jgi:hypothetical protein
MNIHDILLDSGFDLEIKDGDFNIGEVTDQNQKLILISVPGDFKESPSLGVGLEDYLNDERPGDLRDVIRRNLVADGMYVQAITINEKGELDIKAEYE